ncbi:hypothetical protein EB796_000178 [Bugula neritina]|uniref:SNX9 n=1 Tax=Bugula neritina TaxID=10212 RepID=A0A7J7KTN0_BUGNE|nr:hypothetical protein EB796_000178 [Bugula neritina]
MTHVAEDIKVVFMSPINMARKQAKALYDFEGQTPEELSLIADETLTIVNEDVGDGWWEAQNQHGRSGLIPKDYVEVITSMQSLPEPSMPPPPLPGVQAVPAQQSSWQAPAQAGWNNTSSQYTQPVGGWAPPAASTTHTTASAPGADDDDWDDDDWSDDDGSSISTEQNYTGDAHRRVNVPQRDTSASVRTKTVRMSTHNKLGFDIQLLSNPTQSVPESEQVRIIETQRGFEWEANRNSFSCLVDSPKKSSKLKGLKSFTVYQLTPSISGIAVQRRYKHFDWLIGRFVEKYPTIVIPPLPDKQMTGRYEEEFINERMKQLQEWVTRIANHPVVSRSAVWNHFLTCTDEKGWKRGKREAEADKYKGGKFFHTVVTPAAPLEAAQVEKDIDNFYTFTKKMDDGVKELSSAAVDQTKRYPNHFRKEYNKVSQAVNAVKEAFETDGCTDSGPLNNAMAETSKAYADIAIMFQQQPNRDWIPLTDQLQVYRGILSGFEATLGAQKAASAKVRESQKAYEEGKMSDTDVQAFSSHADAISYTLYAEVNHFQANRQQEFKIMMQNLLDEQIDFHRRITQRLEEAKRHYDAF